MPTANVNGANFRDEVLNSDVPVAVDFYADWCGPCRQIARALDVLAREWEGSVLFVRLNVDENQAVARAYRISSIPAVLLFENGEVSAWSIGAKPGYVIERELGLAKRAKQVGRSRDDAVEPRLVPAAGILAAARAWWKRR